MEGVMMRTMNGGIALAVRKADGSIETEYTPKKEESKNPILKWPIVRGVVAFVDSLATGMKMMRFSSPRLYFPPIPVRSVPGAIE